MSSAVAGYVQRLLYFDQHAVEVTQHLVVPEAEHGVAMRFDQLRSGDIGGVAVMLAAVELHHQSRGAAGEVRDVGADRVLEDELPAVQLPVAQCVPQALLRVGAVAAELARDGGQSFLTHVGPPSPNPLPQGRGLSRAR